MNLTRLVAVAALYAATCFGQQVERAWVAFSQYYYEVAATNEFAVFTFSCSRQEEYDVEVSFETIDGTAVAGRDFVGVKTNVLFLAGSTNRMAEVRVPLLTDASASDRAFS